MLTRLTPQTQVSLEEYAYISWFTEKGTFRRISGVTSCPATLLPHSRMVRIRAASFPNMLSLGLRPACTDYSIVIHAGAEHRSPSYSPAECGPDTTIRLFQAGVVGTCGVQKAVSPNERLTLEHGGFLLHTPKVGNLTRLLYSC